MGIFAVKQRQIVASIDQRHFNLVNIRANQKLSDAYVHLRLVKRICQQNHRVWDYI